MNIEREDAFANLHPWSNFIYLTAEISLVIFVSNPILQGISFLAAVAYAFLLFGLKAVQKILWCFPVAILATVMNPLFSHEGATILGYWRNGNPITLESIYYGMGMGIMVLAMLLWFVILNYVMTADKWIHLFGKILPNLALLISMVLRFIPKLQHQHREMKLVHPRKTPFSLFSMLVTWGLETSVDTADSMAARGYGMRGRSRYTIYHFRRIDGIYIGSTLILAVFVFWEILTQRMIFYYYPVLIITGEQGWMLAGYGVFAVLSVLPFVLGIKEKWKWSYLQSKI